MRPVVFDYQAELPRFNGQDGGTWHSPGTHHDLAVGVALFSGFDKRWKRYPCAVKGSWRMDETYSALSSAPFRRVQSPSGARMRSTVSKGGGNTSSAGKRGRYGVPCQS